MPARLLITCLIAVAALGAGGCGTEIGDSCSVAQDCNTDTTDRICDTFSPGGYCTVQGCDFDTCPSEAVCIRFFTGSFTNRVCDPATEDQPGGADECSLDELCALEGHCVPRSAEVRYCMRRCDNQDDCRGEYECRDLQLMRDHGGEPVVAPGQVIAAEPQAFCAAAPM